MLRAGQLQWATVDSPWVHIVDPARYLATIDPLRAMNPDLILSGHLPPAVGRGADFLDMLVQAPAADPYFGPDQRAPEALLASFEPGARSP